MKILAGQLEPTAGNVAVDPNVRVGQLSQDQFAYEEYRVLDAVIMGYEQLVEGHAGTRPALLAARDE